MLLLKCLFLLFFCNVLNASSYSSYYSSSSRCTFPQISNGSARVRQRGNFVKFTCRPRYILMGNKYATCRYGRWDVPLPVCIKSGCDPLEVVNHAVVQSSHSDAWVMFFCFPGYVLAGSPVLYCDGRKWNTTAPRCIDSSAPVKTSCDFEEPDICGWKQDELHDFDWRRLNKRTPSSFLLTGPQYDHTLGKNGSGYYMYIESTSRLTNDTARLISPVFDKKLLKDGCFVFNYHMYGRDIGGLRVYQKADEMSLQDVLNYNENGNNKYRLFDQWGNMGNIWYTGVVTLLDVNDDFQMVIEGIRGQSFMSDIAIDDVAVLQGDNCTAARQGATTPQPIHEESCEGRCFQLREDPSRDVCGCTLGCMVNENCCPDYLEVCAFVDGNGGGNSPDDTDNFTSSTIELPQTQKLIATTTSTQSTTTSTTSTTPSTTTTTTSTTMTTPTTTSTTSSTTMTTTTRRPTTTTRRVTSTVTTPTTKLTSLKTTPTYKTIMKSTTDFKFNATTEMKKTTTSFVSTTKKFTMPVITTRPAIDRYKIISEKQSEIKGTNGVIIAVVVFLLAGLSIGLIYGTYKLRSPEGYATMVKMFGRATGDPEVSFINNDSTDDFDDD